MKPLYLFMLAVSMAACNAGNNNVPAEDSASLMDVNHDGDTTTYISPGNFEPHFSATSFSSTTVNPSALYGVWGASHEDPTCAFSIDSLFLVYCDAEGNAQRFYQVQGDSIFLDGFEVYRGRIEKLTADSLVINWKNNMEGGRFVRWKQ